MAARFEGPKEATERRLIGHTQHLPVYIMGLVFLCGLLIAAVAMPTPTPSEEEKGTLGVGDTEERARFLEIDRSIKFETPTPTPKPTASPSPTPTPEPTEKPTPTPKPYVYVPSSPATVYDAICNQGFSWSCEQAHNIAWCESRWDAGAYNSTVVNLEGPNNAVGLFQLLWPYHAWRFNGGDPYNPYVNASAAHSLYLEKGWQPWC